MAIGYISRPSKISLAVTTQPTTTDYFQGETLDLTGIVVTATRRDGSTENVTSQCTFSPANGSILSSAGTTTITITYHGKTTTTSVTCYQVASIAVTTPPTKTTYNAGDSIDYTGIVVTATALPPTFTKDITSQCTFSPANGTTLSTGGTFNATITWKSYSTSQSYTVTVHIYGAEWAGGSSSAWTRTDDAANFSNPSPATYNGSGSSPFDNIMPWKGMRRVTETVGRGSTQVLVEIPKFYYKWTKTGSAIKLQIANAPVSGFSVSPAHANRDDGKGERDYVYVGAYHSSNQTGLLSARFYPSVTGATPVGNITRATARTYCHNNFVSGTSPYWQWDFDMYWTICMLYLVEYADWDSQRKIGRGNGSGSKGSSPSVTGLTDSMSYHTGTNTSRTSDGHVRYRYIEDLWSNIIDFVDGVTFYNGYIYVQNNPSSYSDNGSGTNFGQVVSSTGKVGSAFNKFNYALLPSSTTLDNNYSTYMCDCYDVLVGNNTIGVPVTGACTNNIGDYYAGLFYFGYVDASMVNSLMGCRVMKLP